MKLKLLPLALVFASAAAVSEEESEKTTTAEVEFGLIATSGNTETTSFVGKLNLKQDLTKFKNHFVLEGLYKEDQVEIEEDGMTRDESRVTAEKYFTSWQTDFKLNTENRAIFGFASYEEDKFSGFEYQATVAAGYADRLFDFERSYLDYNIGPGASFNETEDTIDGDGNLIAGESTTNFVVRVALSYLYQISENSKFTQTIASDVAPSGENTKTKAETAITANISNALALKASFTIDQNTHPVEGKKHADTQTAMTLVYSM